MRFALLHRKRSTNQVPESVFSVISIIEFKPHKPYYIGNITILIVDRTFLYTETLF